MLREISLLWSMIHTLVMFLLLFESRYPKKKTMVISLATMLPLIAANTVLTFILPADKMATAMLMTLSLPSLVIFWVLAKNRDGRFFFTFCFVDTVVLEVIYITQILNFYITPDSDVFLFVVRLAIYPLIEWFVYKKLRGRYLDVQKNTKQGWGSYAFIGAIFYILMSLMMNQPDPITSRPAYYPAMALVFILIPTIYGNIIATLRHQQRMYELQEQENILRLQVNNITARVDDLALADERFRQERHNLRLKMRVIATFAENQKYDELNTYIQEYLDTVQRTQIKRYCKNAVIDAALSAFIQNAENRGIRVEVGFDFPDPIPVDATELATVLANAIENAINACERMGEGEERFIDIKVLSNPSFMIQIKNSFSGKVEFDEDGIPVSCEEGHGFGTRSMVAFCEKHNAFYQFMAKDHEFTLYLNF